MTVDVPPSVVLIGGPTAAGKTAASLAVARAYGAEVVSADAMQVYRGMDIGTAKATAAEQALARHHAIDVRDPHEPFDVSDFLAIADPVIACTPRVVVVGGTSLYLRAVVRGLVHTPAVDLGLRDRLIAEADLHARLAAVDPDLAARIHPNDQVRLVRGLEVHAQTGERLSALQAAHAAEPDRVIAHTVWLDRDDLHARIDQRVIAMIDAGYVTEVRGLLAAGVSPNAKPMRSLGYRHLTAHVREGLDLAEAVRLTQRDTRRFARRQRTWNNTLGWSVATHDHTEAAMAAAAAAWGPPDR